MSQPYAPIADERVEIDLAALLRALRAAMRWLLPVAFAVMIGTFIVLQFVPAKYLGVAKVLIESSSSVYPGDVRGVEEERALLDEEGVASQVQLLTSGDLARRVAKRLDLAAIPEFKARSGGDLVSDLLVGLGVMRDPDRTSPEERVLKVFYRNLDVYRVEGSRVIAVEFSSQDPELAATVANTIVEEYLALQSAAKRQSTEFAATALEPQVERLREEVAAAQKKVEDFRASADLLLGAGNQTLNQQQLGELSSQLSEARAAQSEAEAKARLIRSLLNSGGSLETASDVLNSQLIQRLRERQVALQARVAELSTTLLPNHPQIRALTSQLEDFDRQIRAEARKIMIGLENDAKIAQQQVEALNASLNELKVAAARSNEDQVRLRELEREAAAKASQLDQLLARYREADMRRNAEFLAVDARVISRANVPLEPYAPKIAAITAIATLATLLLGTIWVILGQFLSGNALQRVTYAEPPAPVVAGGESDRPAAEAPPVSDEEASVDDAQAAAPSAQHGKHEAAASHAVQDPAPASAAAAAAARPAEQDERPRRVAVLSVDSDEAAQEVAFRLVRQAADSGILPLFLEVRPDLADPDAVPGFGELLDGTASFTGVIYRDSASRAHVIESGRRLLDDELSTNARFEMVMAAIDHTYDQVFFDLGLIDDSLISAQILAMADRVVVATGGSPAGPELEQALRMLEEHTGAPVVVERVGANDASGRARGDMAA